MGCGSINTKFRREKSLKSNGTQEEKKISNVQEIVVQASNFVRENENKFQDIYRLGRCLGTGGSGEVKTCFHRETNIKRAVKIFRKDLLTNEASKANLEKEINILKTLDHPNIVRIYEYFEDSKRLYVIMEFCKGGELFEEIIKRQTFSEKHAAQIMYQLFSAVAYLHNLMIIHRDLKPENILLEEKNGDLNIKLIDFGTATYSGASRARGEISGTAYYISPEALVGHYTEKCDLWSCGVIMYILLSGIPPFDGKTEDDIIKKVTAGKVNYEINPWPNISEEAKQLLSVLLCPESNRISATEALRHPWVTSRIDRTVTNKEMLNEVLSNLRNFHASSKLRDAVHTFIATQCMAPQDTKGLKEIFLIIDKNGDGKLSKEDLIDQYTEILGAEEAGREVAKIMKEVDTDKNGFVDYTEFLKAALNMEKVLSAENLKTAFKVFDRDGSGSISAAELRKILEGSAPSDDRVWNEIISEVDQNGDGEIDLQEFQDIILAKF
ncbi:unnamed protein product [Blepharisma stoltei]|uniref:non-specific serine/threonine protein kinase n=1 Tax=Blepharisma stoltei TaxID=1481888 RepID=A0AAU9ILS7_9CILI|nr:unnamed protein product [Blepharisma stoltei]